MERLNIDFWYFSVWIFFFFVLTSYLLGYIGFTLAYEKEISHKGRAPVDEIKPILMQHWQVSATCSRTEIQPLAPRHQGRDRCVHVCVHGYGPGRDRDADESGTWIVGCMLCGVVQDRVGYIHAGGRQGILVPRRVSKAWSHGCPSESNFRGVAHRDCAGEPLTTQVWFGSWRSCLMALTTRLTWRKS